MKAARRIRDSVRLRGVPKALARGAARALSRATEPLVHDFDHPTLAELTSASDGITSHEESGITTDTSKALYLAIRLHKPELAVETGVANGRSTFLILSAMEANRAGRLISIDINDNVGVLPRIRRGGVVLSDDIDKNHAFVELAQAVDATPNLLWAERKLFGGIRYAPGDETRG